MMMIMMQTLYEFICCLTFCIRKQIELIIVFNTLSKSNMNSKVFWHFVFKLDQIFGKIWAKCFENITFKVKTTVAAWYVTFENFG